MKQPCRRPAVQPLALAVMMAWAPAWAGPNGAQVVAGQATVSQTAPGQQLITQGTNKAVIDWQNFSIGAGESLRIEQPSASSVLLNRVVGTDPSHILGQMSANGRVFLLNPYGVVFGAGARIDVGGLVASTLDMSNADFMAGNFRLTSAGGPVQRGVLRNEGVISAPGGTVALVGPNVANTGSISADGGRVGLAAANSVLVDVEGDGLIFFQTDATQAGNRLEQLGRLQADGGSVEVRAAARGAFADTVLNLGGVVQARGFGSRNGRIVIDGGAEGIVAVVGRLDASSAEAGHTGGRISVEGQRLQLTGSAALDASGAAGGGSIHVGGGFQGRDPALRNALVTAVAEGATLRADATSQGDGGQVVVWADDTTRFAGAISSRGGAAGGNGGGVEVSGKKTLLFRGDVDTRAPLGERGTLLLDPDNLIVSNDAAAIDATNVNVATGDADVTISANYLSGYTGASITLSAAGDLTFQDAVLNTTAGTSLTATAGNTLTVGASLQVDGALTLAGSSIVLQNNLVSAAGKVQLTGPVALQNQDIAITGASVEIANALTATQSALAVTATNGGITLADSITLSGSGDALSLSATGGTVSARALTTSDGAITLNSASGITLAGNIGSGTAASSFTGPVTLGADVVVTATGSSFSDSVTGAAHALSLLGGGVKSLQAVNVASLSTGTDGSTSLAGNVITTGDQRYGNAVVAAGNVVLDAGSGAVSFAATLDGTTADTESVTVTAGSTSFSGAVGGSARLDALTVTNAADVDGGRIDAVTQRYGSLEIGADTTLAGTDIGVAGATTQSAAHTLTIAATTTSLAAVNVDQLTVSGSATLNANITTTGTQQYADVVLGADAILTGSSVTVTGATTQSGTHALTIAAATSSLGAVTVDQLTANGSATLNGNITTTGTQQYADVVLGADAILTGSSVAISGATTQSGTHALIIAAATSSLGAVTVDQLTANGSATLNGNVTTTGTQQYADVVLGADATLTGSSVTVTGATTQSGATPRHLTITAATSSLGAITLGKLTVGGTATLHGDVSTSDTQQYNNVELGGDRQLTASGSSDVDITGTLAGTYALSVDAGGTTRLRGAVSIDSLSTGASGGTEIGGDITTTGGQRYGNAVWLAGNAVLTAGAAGVDFQGRIDGGRTLSVDTLGETRFRAAVGAGTALAGLATDAGGFTRLGGDVTTTGTQTYGDAVQLVTSVALAATAGDVQFNSAVHAATAGLQSLIVNASGHAGFGAAVGTTALGGLSVSGATIALGNASTAAGAITLTGDTTLGGSIATGGGAFSVTGTTTLAADTTISSGSGNIDFSGAVNGSSAGAQSLNLVSSGSTTFGAAVGAAQRLNTLSTDAGGSTTLRGVATSGDQHYGDAVTMAANATLAGATLRFDDTLTGSGIALALAPTVSATLAGNASLGSLDVTGAAVLGGNVATTGAQTYRGSLTLTGASTLLSASTLDVSGPLDASVAGASALTVATSGAAVFQSALGATRALGGFATTAGGSVSLAELHTQNGAVSLGNNATLNGDVFTNGGSFSAAGSTTLAGATRRIATGAGDVSFSGSVAGSTHGGQSLQIDSSGTTRLDAGAGTAALALASLATDTAGSTQLGGNIYTSGDQNFGDAVTLGATTTIDGNNVQFGGGLALGTNDLVLQLGGNFTLSGTASGTGFVSLAPRNAGQAIYVGSGVANVGEQKYDLGNLGSLSGLGRIGIGSSAGSGTMRVDTLTLAADTKLQTGSGNILLTGAISGSQYQLEVATASGKIELQNTSVNTGSASQTYSGDLVVTGTGVLTGNGITVHGNIDAAGAGTSQLAILGSGSLVLDGNIGSTQALSAFGTGLTLSLQQDLSIAAGAVTLGAVSGNGHALAINSAGVTRLGGAASGLSSLTTDAAGSTTLAGNISTSGNQHYGDAVTLDAAPTLVATAGSVHFDSSLAGPHSLTVDAAGGTTFDAGVSIATLDMRQAATLNGGSVVTTGTQHWRGAVVLGANTSFSGTGINFEADVSGSGALTASGSTTLHADVVTSGAQTYNGPLSLANTSTHSQLLKSSGSITFGGTVNGSAQALTLEAAGTSFAAAVSLAALDVSGAATLNNVTITTSGAQRWRGAVTLAGDTTLASTGAGGLRFDGAIDGLFALTANTAGSTEFNAAVGATDALASLATDAAGSTTLAANVRTSGAQTFNDAVTLGAAATLASTSGGAVTLAAAVTGAHALTVDTAGLTRFDGAVDIASLTTDAAGSTRLAAGVRTSGAQSYGDRVTLAGSFAIESGAALGFGGGITAGGHALTLRAGGALTVGNTVTGTGAAVIEPVAVGTSLGIAGGAGSLQISQATLDRFAGMGSLTLGRSDGSGAINIDNLVLPTSLTLRSGSGTVTFGGTVDSAAGFAHSLNVDTAALTTFAGNVGSINALDGLSVTHAAQVDAASVRSSGTQHYGGTLTFGADTTLLAPGLVFDADFATGTHDVALFTDSLNLAGSVSGTGSARLAAFIAGRSIGLAGAVGTLQLSQSLLDQFAGLSTLHIGRSDGTAAITANSLSLATDTTLHNGSGAVTLGAVTGNGHALAVNSAGITSFNGAVSGVSSLTTDAAGSTRIAADVTTSGNQHYADALTLDSSATLTAAGSVRFASTLGGAHTLTVNASGGTVFDGAASLAALDVQQAATVNGGSITTTGSQQFRGAVTLGANTTFAGSSVSFDAGVSGAHDLTVNASTTLQGDVSTSGAQNYGGTLTLADDVRLTSTGAGIGFTGTVTGAHALTVDAAGGTHFGGAVSIASLEVLKAATLANASITTSGNQQWRGSVSLAGNTTLVSTGAGDVNFDAAIDGPGSLTVNTAGDTQFNATVGATQALAWLSTDAAGRTTLAGNVSTSGAQTYGDALTLAGNSTLTAGAVTFSSTVGGGHALTVNAGGLTRFGAAVNVASLVTDAAGSTQVGADISTTGLQNFRDAVTLTADADFTAGTLVFDGALAAGSFQLGLQTDALTLNGTVSGSGTVALAPTLAATTVGVAGGAGSYQLSQATLSRFTGFATLAIGRTDGSGDMHVGHLVLPMNTVLQSGSGVIHLDGGVDSAAGTAFDLGIRSAAPAQLSGAIGGSTALGRLGVDGLTLMNTASLNAAAIDVAGPLDLGAHDLTLHTNALTLATAASGTGSARLATLAAGGSIGIAGGAGTLQLSQSLLDQFAGLPQLHIGRADGTGAISANAFTLPTAMTLTSASGAVSLAGAVDSAGAARDLRISTGGITTLAGAVGGSSALRSLTIDGAVRLDADTRLSAASVTFASTVDGAHALTVAATTTRFGGAVGGTTALASLSTDAAGSTQLGSGVRTSGAQYYGDDVLLATSSRLQGASVHLAGRVDGVADGAQSLVLDAADTTLGAAVGGTARLAALEITGRSTLAAGHITTTGAQRYGGALTLAGNNTLAAASLHLAGTVNGAHALTLRSSGATRLDADIGSTAALASLDLQLGGAASFGGARITTTGAQHYGGALQLAGSTGFAAASLAFDGAVTGAADLTLHTDALQVGSTLAGSGTLTLATNDAARSIGVAGGAGGLQLAQSVLDGASGFARHVIGRADGSGTVTVGALNLRADTTLQAGRADLRLDGSINGGFDLALNSTGTTRIAADLGTTTALRSLTTDGSGAGGDQTLIDSGNGRTLRIVTSGAQTYRDALVGQSPLAFAAATVEAMNAANRFSGAVSASADSLQLRSASDLRLADVTLASGGSIGTDGTLELTGVLTLQGGTLSLAAQGLPTAIRFTDPDLQDPTLNLRGIALSEASAAIFQSGGRIATAAGSLLSLRTPGGGSIALEQAGNTLLGQLSAVTGTPGDTSTARFENGAGVMLSFVRVASSEIHIAGMPPGAGETAGAAAGLEADAVKLATDWLTTGASGQIRARLPYENLQGSQTSVPGLTLVMGPAALSTHGRFGGATPDSWIQVELGGVTGGYLSVLPKGGGGGGASVLVGGRLEPRPFYDGEGKPGEVRMFYNGAAPRTPQEQGALTAVTATVEEARQARFDDAVRTENVSSRLRAGVIAEVGAGRPATVGTESIRMPETCEPAPGQLHCE